MKNKLLNGDNLEGLKYLLKDNLSRKLDNPEFNKKISNDNIATNSNTAKEVFVTTSLNKKIDKLKVYGIEWVDEDVLIGPTENVLNSIRELIPDLVHNDLIPFRIAPSIDKGVCLAFQKENILLYVEFYNDGDIGLISEDHIKKCIVENIDLTKNELILSLKKILS